MVDWGFVAIVGIAGLFAGAINAVVGSGTLVTYSALLAVGIPPIPANGSNTAGLSPGAFAAVYAYRYELRDRLTELRLPLIASVSGAALGAVLVVALPERVFAAIVPWLIAVGTLLVAVQPIRERLGRRRDRIDSEVTTQPHQTSMGRQRRARVWPWTGLVGIYGGYFGAAQGVLYMAVLTWLYDRNPQNSNAAKNLLAAAANSVAAVVFISVGAIVWPAALMLAASSVVGGYVGGRWARRLPASVLRGMVVAVGIVATTSLLID